MELCSVLCLWQGKVECCIKRLFHFILLLGLPCVYSIKVMLLVPCCCPLLAPFTRLGYSSSSGKTKSKIQIKNSAVIRGGSKSVARAPRDRKGKGRVQSLPKGGGVLIEKSDLHAIGLVGREYWSWNCVPLFSLWQDGVFVRNICRQHFFQPLGPPYLQSQSTS